MAEAAVFGVPDEVMGEVVATRVVARPGVGISAADLKAFCGERLAPHKVPGLIEFSDSLPKGPTGKVLKRLLREGFSVENASAHTPRGYSPAILRDTDPLRGAGEAAPGVLEQDWAEWLDGLPARGLRGRLVQLIREQVADTLGLRDACGVETDVEFTHLGLDSLQGMELRVRLERGVGRRIAATLIFDHPTIEQVADYLADASFGMRRGREHIPAAPASTSDDGLDGLSREEAEARLLRELDELEL